MWGFSLQGAGYPRSMPSHHLIRAILIRVLLINELSAIRRKGAQFQAFLITVEEYIFPGDHFHRCIAQSSHKGFDPGGIPALISTLDDIKELSSMIDQGIGFSGQGANRTTPAPACIFS